MYTFEQLHAAAGKMGTKMQRWAFDMHAQSLRNVLARKAKTKLTIEQCEELIKAAISATEKHNAQFAE